MTIHREGRTLLFVLLIVFFVLNWAVQYFFPENNVIQNVVIGGSVIFYLIILQFFRIPIFSVQKNSKHVIAPADGKVVVIEETEETEYFKGKRKQISIFMSPLNVHANWVPCEGVVKYAKYHKGLYLVAWHPKSSTDNERTTIVVEHPNGKEVLFRQIAGAVARRIVYYIKEGDKVNRNDQFGFIKFGSRVDIFLPTDSKVIVKLNDVTKGNETVIASW